MPLWNLDDWSYLERQLVKDPKGREWVVALMDVLGQEGDPEVPGHLLEAQYGSGRYFTLIYAADGQTIQREQGHAGLDDATAAYDRWLTGVVDGTIDPTQPSFRADLED
jgi:hypothetical protein